jgi:transcriptional regulator with XRE-family HTH domain
MPCPADKRMRQVEIATRFGRNLAGCRKRVGLSQEELGFRSSLHRTEIGMLERGVRLPRIDTLVKLAGALEIPPGELLEGLDWTPGGPRIGQFRVRDDCAAEPEPKPTLRRG